MWDITQFPTWDKIWDILCEVLAYIQGQECSRSYTPVIQGKVWRYFTKGKVIGSTRFVMGAISAQMNSPCWCVSLRHSVDHRIQQWRFPR